MNVLVIKIYSFEFELGFEYFRYFMLVFIVVFI